MGYFSTLLSVLIVICLLGMLEAAIAMSRGTYYAFGKERIPPHPADAYTKARNQQETKP